MCSVLSIRSQVVTNKTSQARANDGRKLELLEEGFYRGLLREIIDARAGSGSGPSQDLLNMRKEKKKKREAERGGSKGRRLRWVLQIEPFANADTGLILWLLQVHRAREDTKLCRACATRAGMA